jgi:hypothetical protein
MEEDYIDSSFLGEFYGVVKFQTWAVTRTAYNFVLGDFSDARPSVSD